METDGGIGLFHLPILVIFGQMGKKFLLLIGMDFFYFGKLKKIIAFLHATDHVGNSRRREMIVRLKKYFK